MSIHSLSDDVAKIIRRLSDLPGSKALSVQTRRYPRLGPAERSSGFQEDRWSMAADEEPAELSIPADTEDVLVTWLGVPNIPEIDQQITLAVDATINEAGGAMNWEYRVFTRSLAEKPEEVVVQIFNSVGVRPN
jgi:hypothetical protein